MKKKKKKTVTKANNNAMTRSAGTETGRNYSQNNGAITTGLVKRDKERTKKIIAKYKTCPNMEATKRRCVLGCEDEAHYWGSLGFCDLLLDLDTINERKRVCLDKNVCLLCLCPGHRQHTCRANITCTWCPPQNKHTQFHSVYQYN